MPGLVVSYFRRFDSSRSTNIYLIVGYLSYFLGSMAWIFIDLATIHSLPFPIISEPMMFLIVLFISWRRNELKTLWSGLFFDPEMKDVTENLLARESQTVDRTNSVEISRLVEETGNIQNAKDTESEEI